MPASLLGLSPTSPATVDAPVFSTLVPASTAKVLAVPNPTGGWGAAWALPAGIATSRPRAATEAIPSGMRPACSIFGGELHVRILRWSILRQQPQVRDCS